MDKPIRIALVGASKWMETHHLPVIKRLTTKYSIELIGIWNRTREKAERLALLWSIPKVYESLIELICDPIPNCRVIVVDRTALFGIINTLNQRPLPFLCEKPPGANFWEADTLARTIKVPHIVGFNRRYTPLHESIGEFLQKQPNPPYWVECSFYRRNRTDPHMITESGIHALNFIEYILSPIERVIKIVKASQDPSLFTGAYIQLKGGVRGFIKFLPCSGQAIEKYEIQGKNYSIFLSMAQPFLDEAKAQISIYWEGKTVLEKIEFLEDPLYQQGFVGEYEDFFQAVLDPNHPTRSNFTNAASSMRAAECIEQGRSNMP